MTIAGQPYRHLLFELILSHSGWRYAEVAAGETFLALQQGPQKALWTLGGVPQVLHSDNTSAATHEVKRSRGRGRAESTITLKQPPGNRAVPQVCHTTSRNRPTGKAICAQSAKHGARSAPTINGRILLDTDIGGDIDDLCALALLLRAPGVEIAGITTVAVRTGRRAGYVRCVLELERRESISLAAGVDVSSGQLRYRSGYPPESDDWPEPVQPVAGPPEDAAEPIGASIAKGAVIAGTGPYSNLALVEHAHPGSLADANLILTGGCIRGPYPGFPRWSNAEDYNVQLDVDSARFVLTRSDPLLAPLEMTTQTALRRAFLPGLANAGASGLVDIPPGRGMRAGRTHCSAPRHELRRVTRRHRKPPPRPACLCKG